MDITFTKLIKEAKEQEKKRAWIKRYSGPSQEVGVTKERLASKELWEDG